ncbi:MAG: type IV pilus twitching motility protein PilT [bacterium]|nr:type IV pilus twitching motility protein PilT [bacterium]
MINTVKLEDLLEETVKYKASDLHLLVGKPPIWRVDGGLMRLEKYDQPLGVEEIERLIFTLLNESQVGIFEEKKELDFSFTYQDKVRFRVNVYYQQGVPALAARAIPNVIPSLEDLNLPPILNRVVSLRQGLVLVTGPTGHGKSTTLAAVIDRIIKSRAVHVITIEDPIEYVYSSELSIVSQREMYNDTLSWANALRSALREDPDVVLVGEMRDLETIAAALTVAETGHLVLATLHTNSAAQTVNRIVDVFPEEQQDQIKLQLSGVLEMVVSQRLVPSRSGGRLPATEIMIANAAVRNSIREGKVSMLDNIIATSTSEGMMSLEMSLAGLVRSGKIDREVAMSFALKPKDLMRLLSSSSL